MATSYEIWVDDESDYGSLFTSEHYRPEDLPQLNRKISAVQVLSIERELKLRDRIRQEILPNLDEHFPNLSVPPGPYSVDDQMLRNSQDLFEQGLVEGIDGSMVTMPVASDLMSLVSCAAVNHRGQPRGLTTQIINLRSDEEVSSPGTEMPVWEILQRRARISSQSHEERDMSARQFMALRERELMANSDATWVVGHGTPVSVDVFSKSGGVEAVASAIRLIRKIVGRENFLFVPSETPSRPELLYIANSLESGQFCIFENLDSWFRILRHGNYSGPVWGPVGDMIDQLASELSETVVVGGFKASRESPGRLFFSHVTHVHQAASIAIADSLLTGHRGFPSIIDIADRVAGRIPSSFLQNSTNLNYAKLGVPFLLRGERDTRR